LVVDASSAISMIVVLVITIQGMVIAGLAQNIKPSMPPFPDTSALMPQVAHHQKEVESQFNQYTFTDTTTLYTLDKAGRVRSQHTDVYYITPTPYQIFALHISHDGKQVSEADLQKQQNTITKKLQEDERKAEKQGEVHPKDTLLFADIMLKSQFSPLRWDEVKGKRVIVYSFEPKAPPRNHGDLVGRIAGDMKGKMWISPDDQEILRVEFSSMAPLSLGMGFLVNVKGFEGYLEQRKVHDEIWLPSHQEYVASGRQFVSGFRIRQVSEYTDFLKATTDVFQQVHVDKSNLHDANTQSAGESHE
jgi:hypothetical protein